MPTPASLELGPTLVELPDQLRPILDQVGSMPGQLRYLFDIFPSLVQIRQTHWVNVGPHWVDVGPNSADPWPILAEIGRIPGHTSRGRAELDEICRVRRNSTNLCEVLSRVEQGLSDKDGPAVVGPNSAGTGLTMPTNIGADGNIWCQHSGPWRQVAPLTPILVGFRDLAGRFRPNLGRPPLGISGPFFLPPS